MPGKENYIELIIDSLAFQGFGVARRENLVYLVRWAVPGDKVIARIVKRKKNYFEAIIDEIIEPSPHRINPSCEYFTVCGGCTWQNIDYQQQLFWKKQHVADCFEHIAKLKINKLHDTLPSPIIYSYRNKMEFSFGASRWLTVEELESGADIEQKDFALGLHVPKRFDKVLDIKKCHIQPDYGNKILDIIRRQALALGVSAWDEKKYTGFLRNLLIRFSQATNEIMVILTTNEIRTQEETKFIDWFVSGFPEALPEITTLIHSLNKTNNPVAVNESHIFKGEGLIYDTIHNIKFRISPYSFFQTNSRQLDRFISLILEYAEIEYGSTVWDLYCGTGSISLPASKLAGIVIGLELSQDSIDDAIINATLNNITNVEFLCTDLHTKQIGELLEALPQPDVVIIDPPRAGMHKYLISALLEITTERIVYVSCNPATQARDCEILNEKYDIISVLPVDMFPQTFHVESIALLEKRNSW